MNLIHKHCGMRQLFGHIVRSPIGSQVVLSLYFLFLYAYFHDIVMFQTWRTYRTVGYLTFLSVDCNLVEDGAMIFFFDFCRCKNNKQERDHYLLTGACPIKFWFLYDNVKYRNTHTHTHIKPILSLWRGRESYPSSFYFILRFDLKLKIIPLLQLLFFMISSRLCLLIFFLKAKKQKQKNNKRNPQWIRNVYHGHTLLIIQFLLSIRRNISLTLSFSFFFCNTYMYIIRDTQRATVGLPPLCVYVCVLQLSTTGNLRVGFVVYIYPTPRYTLLCVCTRLRGGSL